MIHIELTENSVEGEPPPNFHWVGLPDDFFKLLKYIRVLGQHNGRSIVLNSLNLCDIKNGRRVVLTSRKGANALCMLKENDVCVELDKSLWIDVFVKFFGISFYPSHEFIEFDGKNCREDANFIISSELETFSPLIKKQFFS